MQKSNLRPASFFPISPADEKTLHLQRPFGRTLALSFLILVLLLLAMEVVVRTRPFKSHYIPNARGTPHAQLELQFGRLETIAAREGRVDCIFLGNSMVWLGFDPGAFAQTYRQQTGQPLRCFNFGVDGMSAAGAGAIAEILIQDYQPRLLIFGTDARDYAVPRHATDTTVILDTPWLRYRQGHFSLNGWLYEHSHLYRYRRTLGHLLRFEKTYLRIRGPQEIGADDYGFTGDDAVSDFVNTSPAEHLDLGPVQYYFSLLSDYEMLPENLAGLQQILESTGRGTQILLVEMPIPDTYIEFFGHGHQDYDRFLQEVNRHAAASGIPFWYTTSLQLIPPDGWVDYSHLNTKGARIFSRWFAEQLAQAVLDGRIAGLEP